MEIAGIKVEDLEFENIGSWPLSLRILMVLLSFILTFYLGYTIELSSKREALNSLGEKEKQIKKLFSDTQKKTTNLEAYKQEVQMVEEQLNKIIKQLPSSNEEAGLLEDISQEAANNGLQIVAIKPGDQENRGFYHTNIIELELSGNYNGFGEFVSKIANLKRVITLHDFSIKKNTTKGKGALMMNVIAKTYWMPIKGNKK